MLKEYSGLLVGLSLTALFGCSPAPIVPTKAYVGAERSLDEIGIVRVSAEASEFVVLLVEYGEGESKFATTKANSRELRLLPGRYTIKVNCSSGSSYAMPYLYINVHAGSVYEVGCTRTGLDGRTVRAGVLAVKESGASRP